MEGKADGGVIVFDYRCLHFDSRCVYLALSSQPANPKGPGN